MSSIIFDSDIQKYWVLGELNILKKGENKFELLGGNGCLLDMDREATLAVLTLNGPANLNQWSERLEKHGVKAGISKLENILHTIDSNGLLEIKNIELERMDYEKVIENMNKFEKGPLGISNVTISVTEECPYACLYCLRYPIDIGPRVDRQYIIDAIHDIKKLGGRLLTLTGGEPELELEILKQYIKAARDAGIMSRSLATRGYKIDKSIAKELKDVGLTDIVISLDSASEIQDKISSLDGTFKMSTEALQATSDIEGLRTSINFTYYGPNFDQIEPTLKLVSKFNARMKVTPLIPRVGLKPLTIEEMQKFEKLVESLSTDYEIFCLSSKQQRKSYNTPMICEAGVSRAHIEVDGKVSGCQYIAYHSKAISGNVKSGFLNLWSNGDWSFYREGEYVNEKCGKCNDRKYCVNNCLAAADAIFNDPKMLKIPNCDK